MSINCILSKTFFLWGWILDWVGLSSDINPFLDECFGQCPDTTSMLPRVLLPPFSLPTDKVKSGQRSFSWRNFKNVILNLTRQSFYSLLLGEEVWQSYCLYFLEYLWRWDNRKQLTWLCPSQPVLCPEQKLKSEDVYSFQTSSEKDFSSQRDLSLSSALYFHNPNWTPAQLKTVLSSQLIKSLHQSRKTG